LAYRQACDRLEAGAVSAVSTIAIAAFVPAGAIGSFCDALFFLIDTMSTRGASGIVPAANWRMPGAIESSRGVLLFGMSTAFIFAVIQTDFPAITQRLRRDRPPR
jgi:hypothetical protein